MRRLLPLCAALLLAAAAPAAEGTRTRTHLLGPVELVGVQQPMLGPRGSKKLFFEDGWVTGLRARVVDAEGRPADPSYLCHMTFHQPPLDSRHDRLNLDEGMPSIVLPAGFGFPVRAGESYRIEGMLQSDERGTDRELGIAVDVDFVPRASGRLKDLEHVVRSLRADPEDRVQIRDHPGVWRVPPRTKKRYATRFKAPAGRVHFMMFHLHRYAREIVVERADTGETLYRSDVSWDERDHLKASPFYLSAEGFLIEEGVPYRAAVVYDNPTQEPVIAMASVHLYFHRAR